MYGDVASNYQLVVLEAMVETEEATVVNEVGMN